jgi:hypothetical protein
MDSAHCCTPTTTACGWFRAIGTPSRASPVSAKDWLATLKGPPLRSGWRIICLDLHGKPVFTELLFLRAEPIFYAFDILWDEHAQSDDEEEMRGFRNGEDLRYLPLIELTAS